MSEILSPQLVWSIFTRVVVNGENYIEANSKKYEDYSVYFQSADMTEHVYKVF